MACNQCVSCDRLQSNTRSNLLGNCKCVSNDACLQRSLFSFQLIIPSLNSHSCRNKQTSKIWSCQPDEIFPKCLLSLYQHLDIGIWRHSQSHLSWVILEIRLQYLTSPIPNVLSWFWLTSLCKPLIFFLLWSSQTLAGSVRNLITRPLSNRDNLSSSWIFHCLPVSPVT